jgi:hypothetical protein
MMGALAGSGAARSVAVETLQCFHAVRIVA